MHNIIATFSKTTPGQLNNTKILSSTYLSNIDTFNKFFSVSGGDFDPKEINTNLLSLKAGIYWRIIVVKDSLGSRVSSRHLRDTELKTLQVTYLDYHSFFKHKFQNEDFNKLISYTNHQQTIVIFYDANWDNITGLFKDLGREVVGVEPLHLNSTHLLSINQYRLSIFLFGFFNFSPDFWVSESYSKGTNK